MKYAFIPIVVAAIVGFFLVKYNIDNKPTEQLQIKQTGDIFTQDPIVTEEPTDEAAEIIGEFDESTLANVYNQFSAISGEECSMSVDEAGNIPYETGILGGVTYAIFPCDLYAYNVRNFVVAKNQNGDWDLVTFETYNSETKQKGSMSVGLINATFDQLNNQLFTFNKARGLGDCGTSEVYTLDATTKRGTLVQVTGKLECYGEPGEWPIIYTP